MAWIDYVRQHAGGDDDTAIGRRIGVSGASVGRWRTSAPKPESVRAFAAAYQVSVLEAFVAAGFLTAAQARETVVRVDVSSLSDDELVSEVLARMKRGEDRGKTAPIATKGRRGPRRQADISSPPGELVVEVEPWDRKGLAARRVDPGLRDPSTRDDPADG